MAGKFFSPEGESEGPGTAYSESHCSGSRESCYHLDLKCLSRVHVLRTWLPGDSFGGAVGLEEVWPIGRSLGLRRQVLEGDCVTLATLFLSLLPGS